MKTFIATYRFLNRDWLYKLIHDEDLNSKWLFLEKKKCKIKTIRIS